MDEAPQIACRLVSKRCRGGGGESKGQKMIQAGAQLFGGGVGDSCVVRVGRSQGSRLARSMIGTDR